MQEKHCIDCGKVLTGHGKSIRCHRCAAIFWRAPLKKPIPRCADCGVLLSQESVYSNKPIKKCVACARIARYKDKPGNWLGKKHTAKTIDKMRQIALERIARGVEMPNTRGRRHTADELAKISGPNNHGWKGGISNERDKVERTEAYKAWRLSVFASDDFTCCICGKRGKHLHAHHILPFAEHPTLRTEPSNGATLCVPCHRELHRELRRA